MVRDAPCQSRGLARFAARSLASNCSAAASSVSQQLGQSRQRLAAAMITSWSATNPVRHRAQVISIATAPSSSQAEMVMA